MQNTSLLKFRFWGYALATNSWLDTMEGLQERLPGFTVIAESESCRVQAMQNGELDRFGLQFHPEVNDTEFGSNIFENFVNICKSAKSE